MKRTLLFAMLLFLATLPLLAKGTAETQDTADAKLVNNQQEQYAKVHPVPHFDYSIPRDVYTQIYEVVTTKAYMTYTVIESMSGETFYHGTSVGYGIPADTSITNPLRPVWGYSNSSSGVTVEQAEPNGLFSSKNTDGTWVLFVLADGSIAPIYTEHKVTTFPFNVRKSEDGWIRTDDDPVEFTVDLD